MENIWPFFGHHWLLTALFFILLIAIIVVEVLTKSNSSETVTPQQAIQLINQSDAVIIDLRSRDAFVRGHIINAIHIPFKDLQKDIEKLQSHKHKPIILVCSQGAESLKATKLINHSEFENVTVLQGGLKAWQENNLPLEKK